MEVPKVEAEAAAQTEVCRGARVLLGRLVVAAGRRPILVLDMSLVVPQGLYLVLLHPVNQKVVWISMGRKQCIFVIILVVIFFKRLLPFPSTEFR